MFGVGIDVGGVRIDVGGVWINVSGVRVGGIGVGHHIRALANRIIGVRQDRAVGGKVGYGAIRLGIIVPGLGRCAANGSYGCGQCRLCPDINRQSGHQGQGEYFCFHRFSEPAER